MSVSQPTSHLKKDEIADFTNHLERFEELIDSITPKKIEVEEMNFKHATLQQLNTIICHEDCPLIYKAFAESEIERRLVERGMTYPA